MMAKIFLRSFVLATLLWPITTGSAFSSTATDDCLMDWFEANYSSFIRPAGATSAYLGPYYFRFYAQTQSYLATNVEDGHVYYMGPATNNTILDLGPVSNWLSSTTCMSGSGAPTPTILSAEFEPGNCRNYIAWDDVGAAQYKMYWGTSSDVTTGSQLATPTTTTDYGHTGVVPGWTYYYRIMAVFADGSESALSAVASALVPADAAQNCGNSNPSPLPDTGQTQKYTTTTFGEDSDYTINPPSYTNNGNGTVTDNVTGLMWQQNSGTVSYNWYKAAGVYDATYNPTTLDVCDAQTTGGHNDWRLPTKKELTGIIDYGRYNPSLNPVFSAVASNYWSSTTYANYSSDAWGVDFYGGDVSYYNKSDGYSVRCVRGGQ